MLSKRVTIIAQTYSRCRTLCPVVSTQITQVQCKSDGIMGKVKGIFGGKKDDPDSAENKEAEKDEMYEFDLATEKEFEEEARQAAIRKARFRSRLFHSDRALLLNQRPNAGIDFEMNDKHQRNDFKAAMLSRFGKSTGINPSVAWPTDEKIDEQKEYEHVLYDGKSLKEMIADVQQQVVEEEKQIRDTEDEIKKKIAKQEQEIKAWQKRVESKNMAADKERLKRQRILDELRDEFGYEINPDDPQFAPRIEAKEKEIAKMNKDAKKAKAKEFAEQKMLEERAEIEAKAKKMEEEAQKS